jgi:hypothetical protein
MHGVRNQRSVYFIVTALRTLIVIYLLFYDAVIIIDIDTCMGVSVNNNCGLWISRLGLSGVNSTITLGYNSSHIQLFLDAESLTVVCIFCTSLL